MYPFATKSFAATQVPPKNLDPAEPIAKSQWGETLRRIFMTVYTWDGWEGAGGDSSRYTVPNRS
jgi:hypothetical protein